MGGGEVARYLSTHGSARVRSAVFASAVPPYLMQTDDNPDGPLTKEAAATMTADLTKDEDAFYDCMAFFPGCPGVGGHCWLTVISYVRDAAS